MRAFHGCKPPCGDATATAWFVGGSASQSNLTFTRDQIEIRTFPPHVEEELSNTYWTRVDVAGRTLADNTSETNSPQFGIASKRPGEHTT